MQETQRNQLVAPIEKLLPRFRCALALSQQIVPMQVTIDRPFFFVIRDRINGELVSWKSDLALAREEMAYLERKFEEQ